MLCDLDSTFVSNIKVETAPGPVTRSDTFNNDLISIKTISGEDKINGLLDPANPRIKDRVFVNQGKLIGIVNPLTQWDFGDGKLRQVARAVIWEIEISSANPDPVPVIIKGERADGTPGDPWKIGLKFDKSTVISIALTDKEEREIEDYYTYKPSHLAHPDHDFLLNYALLATWQVDANGIANVVCKGGGGQPSQGKCLYPSLDSGAWVNPRHR
jgi:hypothetical protein